MQSAQLVPTLPGVKLDEFGSDLMSAEASPSDLLPLTLMDTLPKRALLAP